MVEILIELEECAGVGAHRQPERAMDAPTAHCCSSRETVMHSQRDSTSRRS